MQRQMRVITGAAEARMRSGVEAAYDHFRLERQGDLASPATLEHYDYMVGPFPRWLAAQQLSPGAHDVLPVGAHRGL
jgi:hypothetical protein